MALSAHPTNTIQWENFEFSYFVQRFILFAWLNGKNFIVYIMSTILLFICLITWRKYEKSTWCGWIRRHGMLVNCSRLLTIFTYTGKKWCFYIRSLLECYMWLSALKQLFRRHKKQFSALFLELDYKWMIEIYSNTCYTHLLLVFLLELCRKPLKICS
jgi:hypothetical protein